MNLPLHLGWLGALEAGLIALAIGIVCHVVFQALAARFRWGPGHAIGWACLAAVAIGAGVDLWNLFHLGVVRLESPVYARIVLSKIHDPDGLGTRVVMEILGALAGVGLGVAVGARAGVKSGSGERE